MSKYKKHSLGFTLMEIMMVIIIMGILLAYAIPNYNKSIRKGYEKQMLQNAYTLYSAMKNYYYQNNASTSCAFPDFDLPSSGGFNFVSAAKLNDHLSINLPRQERISYQYGYTCGKLYGFRIYHNEGAGNNGFIISFTGGFDNAGEEIKLSATNPSCVGLNDCPSVPREE